MHQLVMDSTVVLVHKDLLSGTPKHIFNLFNDDYNVKTGIASQKLLKPEQTNAPKKDLAMESFKWRSIKDNKLLPLAIRSTSPILKSKKVFKTWISEFIPLANAPPGHASFTVSHQIDRSLCQNIVI